MRKIILLILIIISITSNIGFSQAKINMGVNITEYPEVPTWAPLSVNHIPSSVNFTMDDFVDNEEYRITKVEEAPYLATSVSMAVGSSGITSGSTFTWHSGDEFGFSYVIPANTGYGQTQLIKFQIERKRIWGWDWQTSWFYYLSPTCVTNTIISQGTYDLFAIDYEVSNGLTVSSIAFPNGGITELDGGGYVLLQPGFYSNMSGGGVVSAIINGCQGAYRFGNMFSNNSKEAYQGIKDSNQNIMIYPNPTQNQITVKIPESLRANEIHIDIIDINGKNILSENKVNEELLYFDLSQFDAGIYFISVTGNHFNHHQKIIKQ